MSKFVSPSDDDKTTLRRRAVSARHQLRDKPSRSQKIQSRLESIPAITQARTRLVYLGVRDEVHTAELVTRWLDHDCQVVIPWCTPDDNLALFWLRDWHELRPGKFGILEPTLTCRTNNQRLVSPEAIDIALIPGVAFDVLGGRLGHGKGYYDKLLASVRSDCIRLGLAFECQILSHIPMAAHDIFMHGVVTEERTIWVD